MSLFRKTLHIFIPSHFRDPTGLFLRLIRSKSPAAWYAMAYALAGVLLTPLDYLLQPLEKHLYRQAPPPRLPLIFVCGAPRTGTTLAMQVLTNHLPVCYPNNLTSLFPRSPIAANLLLKMVIAERTQPYTSYYGKSQYLSGPNDALYLWDRWLGKDRTRIPASLSNSKKEEMRRFFGAYQQVFKKPFLNKNNNLNVFAHLIADALENSYFICMTRDPLFLAQSLIIARKEIHGDTSIAYGIDNPDKPAAVKEDLVMDVCDQVMFHNRMVQRQQDIIGPERFWIIPYEHFCKHPEDLVRQVTEKILKRPWDQSGISPRIKPFQVSNRVRLEADLLNALEARLLEIKTTQSGSA